MGVVLGVHVRVHDSLNCSGCFVVSCAALAEVGGRIYVFQSGLGAVGEGKLANRENAKLYVLLCACSCCVL